MNSLFLSLDFSFFRFFSGFLGGLFCIQEISPLLNYGFLLPGIIITLCLNLCKSCNNGELPRYTEDI